MRRALVLTALALVVLPAASASAAPIHHHSTVSIGYSGNFYGVVDSPASRCVRFRTVQLLYDSGPVTKARAFSVIGQDVTDTEGNWLVNPGKIAAGYYQAKATRKVYRRHGRRHVCDPAKSQVIGLF